MSALIRFAGLMCKDTNRKFSFRAVVVYTTSTVHDIASHGSRVITEAPADVGLGRWFDLWPKGFCLFLVLTTLIFFSSLGLPPSVL